MNEKKNSSPNNDKSGKMIRKKEATKKFIVILFAKENLRLPSCKPLNMVRFYGYASVQLIFMHPTDIVLKGRQNRQSINDE